MYIGYGPLNYFFSFQKIYKMVILKLHARQIFDSRGNPTVEVDLTTEKGWKILLHIF